jgi:hypothetical protein
MILSFILDYAIIEINILSNREPLQLHGTYNILVTKKINLAIKLEALYWESWAPYSSETFAI